MIEQKKEFERFQTDYNQNKTTEHKCAISKVSQLQHLTLTNFELLKINNEM